MQTNQLPDPARAKTFFEQKMAFTTGPVELEHMIKAGDSIVVVDVRDPSDFAEEHVPGAINIPQDAWANPAGLQKDKTNIVYCYSQTCHLGARACATFAARGFPVMEREGGYDAWKENDFEVEGEESEEESPRRMNQPGGGSPADRRR